ISRIVPSGQYHGDHYEAVELSVLRHKGCGAASIGAGLFMKPACAVAGTTQESEYRREQEMSVRTIRTTTMACAVTMTAVLSVAPLRTKTPQTPETTQAALSKEAGTLSDKFAVLARVMAGEYDWKPCEGVRSVGDVFNLIVTENGLLAGTLTGAGG